MPGMMSLVETLVRDLRYALRSLRRDAALTTFAILIIGVGVLPPSFDFGGTFSPGRPADLFLPFPLSPETNRRGTRLR